MSHKLNSEQLALLRAINSRDVTWRQDGQLVQDRGADRLSNRFGIVTARVIDLEVAGLVMFPTLDTPSGPIKGSPRLTEQGRARLRAERMIS
jgi:hypothetical protein